VKKMIRRFHRFPHRMEHEGGAILPLVAVGAVALMGALGVSVDVGNVLVVKQELDVAAKEAALAGASTLAQGGTNLQAQTNASNVISKSVSNGAVQNSVPMSALVPGWYDPAKQTFSSSQCSGCLAAMQVKNVISGPSTSGGYVKTLFSQVLPQIQTALPKGFSPVGSATAATGVAPASAAPGQVLPLALPKSLLTALWDPATQQPRLASNSNPIFSPIKGGVPAPSQTHGQPYTVRVWDNSCGVPNTQTIPGVGSLPPTTGSWHSYDSSNNQDLCQSQESGDHQGYDSHQYGGRYSYSGSNNGSTPIANAKEMRSVASQGAATPVNFCNHSDAQTARQSVQKACGSGNYAGYVPIWDDDECSGNSCPIQTFAAVKIVGHGESDQLSAGKSTVTCGYVDVQLIPPGQKQVSLQQDATHGIANYSTFSCTMEGRGTADPRQSYVSGTPKIVRCSN